ncbi:MAG: glutamate racemase [Anaerolineales bacterium]|nr:glutamate racemase [Anaerolineales bacterium]
MRPIAIFDSGVGGLSVLRAVRQQLPMEPLLYFADQAHVPYGSRSLDEVRSLSEAITHFLLAQGSKMIVVACNTASAAALHHLRQAFPDIPFVGMEPAVKPAAETTQTGVVGVLATPATFQGALYASVVERFANGVTLLQNTCPGLVSQIESGSLDSAETRRILEDALQPMLAHNIDTIVLGCTHYPFVIPLIQQVAGPSIRVIDPAPAVARQVSRLLEAHGLHDLGALWKRNMLGLAQAPMQFISSGDPAALQALLPRLVGIQASVEQARWVNGELILHISH